MKYQIRPIEEKDIEEIIKGEELVFGSSLGFDLIYSDIKLNPYAVYLVLEIKKKVSGYIGLWINPDFSEIINFYVLPEYQGMGFGQMLLDFAMELSRKSKVPSMSLEVRRGNEKAIKLYEKNGFVFSHVRDKYYSDGTDALVLIKDFKEEN